VIPLANILQPLIDPLNSLLVVFHDFLGSWGFSIILLTVCVRVLLIPLTLKQFKSMQGLQKFAPEIKKLQEKYKDDKQRQQQELMKFYQEHKINPFASCLPLLLQMPFFIALFYALQGDLRRDMCEQTARPCGEVPGTWGESFFFIPDLTDNATGVVLVVLLVLYVGSQLLSSVLLAVTADKNQRIIMTALPFIFVPFIITFPAGLLVYWITTNFWTVGQQYIIRRSAGMAVLGSPGKEEAPGVPLGAAALSKGADGGRSGGGKRSSVTANGADGDGNGAGTKAKAGATAGAVRAAAPPPPPRTKKKKRSGRRR
jgi:YidC/Oxa1 family membrane protein insertase